MARRLATMGDAQWRRFMQWSQLKKRVEALFADSVKGRVELHTTRYHKAHDRMGRGWITVDKNQIVNMCDYAYEFRQWQEAESLHQATGCLDFRNPSHQEGYYQAYDLANKILSDKSVFPRGDFTRSLFDYLNRPVDFILKSPNPIIRAIGMLDHRVGKRRLAIMDVTKEHTLVQKLHRVRCELEGSSPQAVNPDAV